MATRASSSTEDAKRPWPRTRFDEPFGRVITSVFRGHGRSRECGLRCENRVLEMKGKDSVNSLEESVRNDLRRRPS
jgi:hypothetical protein